jgi:hypothetical protein
MEVRRTSDESLWTDRSPWTDGGLMDKSSTDVLGWTKIGDVTLKVMAS